MYSCVPVFLCVRMRTYLRETLPVCAGERVFMRKHDSVRLGARVWMGAGVSVLENKTVYDPSSSVRTKACVCV